MTSNNCRLTGIEVFCSEILDFNLVLCELINQHETSDDLTEIHFFLSTYLIKHSAVAISLDLTTSFLKKKQIVSDLSLYIKNADPIVLEKIGAVLCKLFEYDEAYTTKKAHDQGIDIIGVRKLRYFDSTRKSYIIGQSKAYSTGLVDVRDVRELAGAILLLRHKEFSQEIIAYPEINITSFSPITAIFVTSFFFSEPARKLCEQSGILPLDFLDLVCIFSNAAVNKKIDIMTDNRLDATKMKYLLNQIQSIN